jgi:hypothetical protein
MDVYPLLRENFDRLYEQYDAHTDVVRALQATFTEEILPDLQDELHLDAESNHWAREWLQDTCKSSTQLPTDLPRMLIGDQHVFSTS